MRKLNKFTRGVGVYECKVCHHRTRETGDGAGVGLCELCFEIAGIENQQLDSDNPREIAELQAEIDKLSKKVDQRNSNRKTANGGNRSTTKENVMAKAIKNVKGTKAVKQVKTTKTTKKVEEISKGRAAALKAWETIRANRAAAEKAAKKAA